MLGRSAKKFSDLEKFVINNKKFEDKRVLAEYKYDGERCQLHYDGKRINLYSRGYEIQNFKFFSLLNNLENYFNSELPEINN